MISNGFLIWIFIGLGVPVYCSEENQFFRVRPSDREAKEGEDVEFECHVANRAGDVQWSKDGFLLGFDPQIPGYPRYSMDVKEDRGIYNLHIKNVNFQDEGEFQCQVGPALNHTPIRAAAQLKILIPPEYISVNGLGQASTVEVKANSSVRLTCRAVGSKPPAKLKWYRDNAEVPKDSVHTEEKKDKTRFIATSYLTVRPAVKDDGSKFACEAFHKALDHRMRTEVTLSVLHAPGQPRIEGYREGTTVKAGEPLTLVCLSEGGNPPPRLVWYRGNAQIDATYHLSESDGVTSNNLTLVVSAEDNTGAYHCRATNAVVQEPLVTSIKLNVFYLSTKMWIRGPTEAPRGGIVTLSCETDVSNPRPELTWWMDGRELQDGEVTHKSTRDGWITTSNLTITLTRQEPDTKTFTCSAQNPHVSGSATTTHKLRVIYSPRPPVIQGYESNTPLRVGDIQRFNCVSVGGNPPAMIRWFKGDREISTPVVTTGSGVSSELVVRVQASDHGLMYRCEASNSALKKPLSAFVTLAVKFPPANVSIAVIPSEPKAGDNVTLTCLSSPSNPISRLSWKRDGSPVSGHREETLGSSPLGTGVASRSTLELRDATPALDGTEYICTATNEEFGTVVARVTLRIRHPPVFLSPQQKTVEVTEKHSVSINATAHAFPEPIHYSWSKEGTPLAETSERLLAVGAVLHVRNATRKDSGSYQCIAENEEGRSRLEVQLNVLYGATVQSVTITSPSGPVFEGSEATLECRVTARPALQDMVQWRLRGGPARSGIQQQPGDYTKSVLRIANVSRDLRGPVECWADNGIGGPSVMSVLLNVLYKPIVIQSSGELDDKEKTTARMRCLVEGTPNVTIAWSLDGIRLRMRGGDKYSVASSQQGESHFASVLIIREVDRQDYGVYTCTATNLLGTDSADITLDDRGVSPNSAPTTAVATDSDDSHSRHGAPFLRGWWLVAVGGASTLVLSCCLLFTCCLRKRSNRTTPERSTATRHIDLSPLSADDVCNKLLLSADVKSILLCAEKPRLPLHELKGHSVFTIEETYKIDNMRSRHMPGEQEGKSLESGLKDVFMEEIPHSLDKTKGDCPDILRNEKCLCLTTTSKECVESPQSDSPESPRFNSTPSGSTGSCLSVYHEKTSIRSLGDLDGAAMMKLHPIMVLRIDEDAYKFSET